MKVGRLSVGHAGTSHEPPGWRHPFPAPRDDSPPRDCDLASRPARSVHRAMHVPGVTGRFRQGRQQWLPSLPNSLYLPRSL